MRIVSLETFRPRFQANECLVQLTGDDGSRGLGEAFFHSAASEAYLHESVAPVLFEIPDCSPEVVSRALEPYVGYDGSGVETRCRGAIDIALWDLLGKAAGLSVARLLGGSPCRVPVYNTCAGTQYVGSSSRQESSNWGVAGSGEFEDLWRFLNEPGPLARELADAGFRGMKVWPFDQAAERTHGTAIGIGELDAGRRIIGEIRDAVGDQIDVMIELHGLWQAGPALRIIEATSEFRPFWYEDPVRPDRVLALRSLRERTPATLAMGETIGSLAHYSALLGAGLLDVATIDIQWIGGLTQASKVAAVAEAAGVPIAPHDCTGPVSLAAATQFTSSSPNGLIQEVCRAFAAGWYRRLVTGLPEWVDGHIEISERPGLGLEILAGLADDSEIIHRATTRVNTQTTSRRT